MADADESTEAHRQEPEGHWAIGLTFHVPRRGRPLFRATAGQILMPQLIALRDAGRIVAVLAFRHRPLKARGEAEWTSWEAKGTSWTDYWVLVVATGVDPNDIWNTISLSAGIAGEASSLGFLRAEVLRPQPGMQMYYPRNGGLQQESRLWHWIEYAVSRPDARQAYYQDQYRFSAPSIRRFYETGAVGRVIGFEVARVLESRGARPAWDVIHITGAMSFLKIAWVLWRQMAVFNGFARNAGHSSALDVIRSWDVQREKYQVHGVQASNYTLQPVNDLSLVTASPASST
jgi:hypothetical protein